MGGIQIDDEQWNMILEESDVNKDGEVQIIFKLRFHSRNSYN